MHTHTQIHICPQIYTHMLIYKTCIPHASSTIMSKALESNFLQKMTLFLTNLANSLHCLPNLLYNVGLISMRIFLKNPSMLCACLCKE